MVAQPHYLLFCDTHHNDVQQATSAPSVHTGNGSGRWHFVLERLDGPERLEAADSEAAVNRERLALLSVVRGLEALEQPSQVTLVTTSRYVSRGLRYGLNTWRESNYTWERFGEQRPVRNSDLWRRVDTALLFHGVKCRLIQAGQAEHNPSAPAIAALPHPFPLPASDRATEHSLVAAVAARLVESLPPCQASQTDKVATSQSAYAAVANGSWGGTGEATGQKLVAYRPAAHNLRYGTRRNLSARTKRNLQVSQDQWWNLAAAWIRWWRGRLQNRPAFHGT